MKYRTKFSTFSLSLAALLSLSGCNSDEKTMPFSSESVSTLSGMVADGYLVGAKVCLDKNYNDACDTDEPFVMTDASGRYTFVLKEMTAVELPIIVEADETTVDLDTNTSIGEKWHFKAAVGNHGFISPLTTLVAQEMELNASLTLEQAMSNLQSELGMEINSTTDYIATNNLKAHNAAKIIARSLANSEESLRAASPDSDSRLVRLLAAKQIRLQALAIKTASENNDTSYVCDVNTTNVDGQIDEISAVIASLLSPQLQDDLLFMWEEERLARDVYTALYAKWGSKIFTNIANNGEQTHMDSVKAMIDKYQVDVSSYDPVVAGIFVNQELQALYNTLVAQGSVSSIEAYKVGVLIEETDIADLDQRLLPVDLPSDIRTVYENLKKGSLNHLAAFNKQL